MREQGGSGAGSVLLAFFLGGVVGAGLALMYSPLSGTEARERLTGLKDDLADKKEHYADEVKEKVSETVQKGKDFVEKKKSLVSTAIEAGKEAYEKEKDKSESA
jgi:gas vesicle protein